MQGIRRFIKDRPNHTIISISHINKVLVNSTIHGSYQNIGSRMIKMERTLWSSEGGSSILGNGMIGLDMVKDKNRNIGWKVGGSRLIIQEL